MFSATKQFRGDSRLKKKLQDPVLLILALLAFVFPASITLIHSPATSPLDEWVFIDYTSKVLDQGYVHDGERVGAFTNDVMACRGVMPGNTFGTCGADLAANYPNLPYSGLTAASAYTPLYFAVTRVLGAPFQLLGIDAVTSWRLTGGLWLAAAVIILILTLRRWRIPDGAIFPLGLLLIASPFVWWAHTFVSTDAPSLFMGGVLLYLATRIREGLNLGWALVLGSILATAFKVTNLVSVGLVAIYLIGSWVIAYLTRKRSDADPVPVLSPTSFIVWPVLAVLLSVGVQWSWLKFISATSIPGERANQGISSPLSLSELGMQTTNFLSSVASYSPFSGHGHDFLFVPISWVLITGVLGSLFTLRSSELSWQIALATFVAAVAMAPLLAIAVQLAQGAYFQLSPRYGASLVPAFILSTGLILRNKVAQWGVAVYSGGLLLVGLAAAFMLN